MRELRFVFSALLLAGMVFVGFTDPSRSRTEWSETSNFRLKTEACRDLWEQREQTSFTWPEAEEQSVTLAEVAQRFGLELKKICAANGHPPACGTAILNPGERVELPLDPNLPIASISPSVETIPQPAEEVTP